MTMLDYPGKLSCIIWLSGCSMCCPYCYNPSIVNEKGRQTLKELFAFLKKRIGLLDGVVLSGGESTMYEGIVELCEQIKTMGFLIKIDTNGIQPKVLKELLKKELVDYIALDYKAPKYKFDKITGVEDTYKLFKKSLTMLCKQSKVDFEVRTAVHTDLLNEEDINNIIKDLVKSGYKNTYYLQKFINDTETIGNLPNATRWLNMNELSNKLNIEVR